MASPSTSWLGCTGGGVGTPVEHWGHGRAEHQAHRVAHRPPATRITASVTWPGPGPSSQVITVTGRALMARSCPW